MSRVVAREIANPSLPGPACSTDAVYVGLSLRGQFIVDNKIQVFDMDAPACHVSGNKKACTLWFETGQAPDPIELLEVSVQTVHAGTLGRPGSVLVRRQLL